MTGAVGGAVGGAAEPGGAGEGAMSAWELVGGAGIRGGMIIGAALDIGV